MSTEPRDENLRDLATRVAELPGVDVELDDDRAARAIFTIPDLQTALRLEWPTMAFLGLPALAIVISSIVQLISNGAETAAQITVLIFVAPVLLILAFVILYSRRKSRRVVELSPDVIGPGPWMLAQSGEHCYERGEIIRLEKVRRSDTLTHLSPGHIVVETAFHRATFGGHLRDDELDVLWEFVVEMTGLETITIPWKRMLVFSGLVGVLCAGATFVGADALLRSGPNPQLVHVFASLTVGAVAFGLTLGAWRRTSPTLLQPDS